MFGRIAALFLFLLPAPLLAEWHEASSDHFLVIADQSERDVREFTQRLERYHSALTEVMKQPNAKPSPSNRVTIYVVRSGSDVRKLAGDTSGFLQGFYQPRAGGSVAFISRVDSSGGRDLDDSERVLFHEYAHHVMHSNNEWVSPRWLSEGFAEFYSTARFERDVETVRAILAAEPPPTKTGARQAGAKPMVEPEPLYPALPSAALQIDTPAS